MSPNRLCRISCGGCERRAGSFTMTIAVTGFVTSKGRLRPGVINTCRGGRALREISIAPAGFRLLPVEIAFAHAASPSSHDDSTSNHHLPRPSTKHTGSGLQFHGHAFDHFSHVRPVPCGGTKLSAKAAARSATTSRSFYECLPFLETNPRSRLGSPRAELAGSGAV